MSLGLLVASLKYGLYIVHQSKWFVVLFRLFISSPFNGSTVVIMAIRSSCSGEVFMLSLFC